MQLQAGRYFAHEHPETATSWGEDIICKLQENPEVMHTVIDQCMYGLVSKDAQGEAPAKKPTKFLTNSIAIKNELGMRCDKSHRHVQLMEGRALAAQRYPKGLCRTTTRGIIMQAKLDAADMMSLNVDDIKKMIQEDMDNGMNEINQIDHEPDEWKSYWDDISGEKLDAEFTKEARKEEIRGVHQMKVYEKVPMEMCLKETGKKPIGTR